MSTDMAPPTAPKPEPHNWLQDLDIAVEILCPALALIFTVLRVQYRIRRKTFGWDDACIILAMILSIVMGVGTILYMKYLYVGIHKEDVPYERMNFKAGLIWIYVVGSVYNPILAIVKQSVLFFLLRLASIKPGVRTAVWVTSAFNLALMVATLLTVIFQCTPISLNWNVDPNAEGHCIKKVHFAVSTACLTIVTDIMALALPFYIFLGLNMNRKKKIALMAVFLLGLVVTAVGVVRMYFLWYNFGLIKTPDPNYSFNYCVAAIEVNLAIITASAPALWPLLSAVIPKLMTSLGRTSRGYQQNKDTDWTPHGTFQSSNIVKGGGSHIALKSLKESKSRTLPRTVDGDSDEEALTHNGPGIQRVIQVSVTHGNESQHSGLDSGPSGKYMERSAHAR